MSGVEGILFRIENRLDKMAADLAGMADDLKAIRSALVRPVEESDLHLPSPKSPVFDGDGREIIPVHNYAGIYPLLATCGRCSRPLALGNPTGTWQHCD